MRIRFIISKSENHRVRRNQLTWSGLGFRGMAPMRINIHECHTSPAFQIYYQNKERKIKYKDTKNEIEDWGLMITYLERSKEDQDSWSHRSSSLDFPLLFFSYHDTTQLTSWDDWFIHPTTEEREIPWLTVERLESFIDIWASAH